MKTPLDGVYSERFIGSTPEDVYAKWTEHKTAYDNHWPVLDHFWEVGENSSWYSLTVIYTRDNLPNI